MIVPILIMYVRRIWQWWRQFSREHRDEMPVFGKDYLAFLGWNNSVRFDRTNHLAIPVNDFYPILFFICQFIYTHHIAYANFPLECQ